MSIKRPITMYNKANHIPDAVNPKKLYIAEYSQLLNSHCVKRIRYHVRCCLRANRTLQETLMQVGKDWGLTGQVNYIVENEFSLNLTNEL